MDSDDVMIPERLRIQVEFMEQNSEIAVCGSFAESFGTRTKMMRGDTEHNNLISSMLLYNPLIHPAIIMRRSIFETIEYKKNYPCH